MDPKRKTRKSQQVAWPRLTLIEEKQDLERLEPGDLAPGWESRGRGRLHRWPDPLDELPPPCFRSF